MKMAMVKNAENSDPMPLRLGHIEGYSGMKNEIIYHSPKCDIKGYVIFFGGDIQDFKENMMKHRDNKDHVEWDLESTCTRLHHRFPDFAILVIKPVKMSLMTFSCYENFVQVNNFGAPTYAEKSDSLRHLKALLLNVELIVNTQVKYDNTCSVQNKPLILIGFSKGCVVLNQFLYSFFAINKDGDEEMQLFVNSITDMYWLEGGHSGVSETWVTKKSVLTNFASMKKSVHIHVTPYQVLCDTRPRIGKEEKIFRETLIQMCADVKRTLHFVDEPRSLENHFRVLEVFQSLS